MTDRPTKDDNYNMRMADNKEAYRFCEKLIATIGDLTEALEWTKTNYNFTVMAFFKFMLLASKQCSTFFKFILFVSKQCNATILR